ncbi:iron complex transport system substrate-binding protein [Amycolatopsis bartoniae]|uniref:ABC transporter substrate-binding protein n=1 Tax=Amycolatopsis bartoniae TaxID=941986 RepID=A0A8H9J3B1_9PSEU|nr:ABC transporter substrate-binding protein [Amycolatopsis bartoniae]MBB2933786.1 iron complex transport system substrate-binding protein [Amycolatopsis bartoniae]TVT10554.1 ABC transporter substrate-binding protein [Amycolatopsis bartoniae]GHF71737.1 ABC transporter substrate-binding protein [Amycolatopsis bartoniae]
MSRKRILGALLLAGAVFGLVACGDVQDSSSAPSSSAAAADASAFPVTITHKFGSTTIDKAPSRVVVIGTSSDDLDAALALGVTPVAFFNKSGVSGVPTYLQGKVDTAKTKIVDATNGVNAEEVGALTPDLILATADYGLDQEYANLSKIAPTVGYATEWGAQSWQEHVQVTAKALGKSAQAQQVIDTTQAAIDKVKADYPKAGGKTFTASVGNTAGKVFTLVSQQDFAVQLIQSLGLKLSPNVANLGQNDSGSPTGSLSPEQYDKLAADLVVIAFTSPDLRQAFESNQLVANVKSGNYLVTDMETISALRYPTVYDIPWVLDKLKPALAKF